jgi:hypothetical protein
MTRLRTPLAIAAVLLATTACTTKVSGNPTGQLGRGSTVTATSRPLPSAVSIPDDAHACDLVDERAAADAGMDGPLKAFRNMWGTACSGASAVSLFVMLTHGPSQGVGEYPPEMGAQVAVRKFGAFVARQEKVDQYCGLVVELVPGRALVVRLESKDKNRCDKVEALVTQALHTLAPTR